MEQWSEEAVETLLRDLAKDIESEEGWKKFHAVHHGRLIIYLRRHFSFDFTTCDGLAHDTITRFYQAFRNEPDHFKSAKEVWGGSTEPAIDVRSIIVGGRKNQGRTERVLRQSLKSQPISMKTISPLSKKQRPLRRRNDAYVLLRSAFV